MSGSPNWPLQEAILARLEGDAEISETIGAVVYDAVPEEAGFPRVVIGAFTGSPNDTMGRTGRDTTVTIHGFSRYPGKKETEALMNRIDELLDRWTPAVPGWKTVQLLNDYGPEVLTEPDNETQHGVARYRIHLKQGA